MFKMAQPRVPFASSLRVSRVDFTTSAFASAIRHTEHYHVRLGPVCLTLSCAGIAYDQRNRGSSGVLFSIDYET
jgi:hypothetical protein